MLIINKRDLLPFIVVASTLFFTNEAQAKDINVKNEQQLQDAISNITEETTINIDPDYETTTTEGLKVTIKGTHPVTINANNFNFRGESKIDNQNTSNITLKNFIVDGSKPAKFDEEGTLEVANNSSKGQVNFEHAIFKNLKSQQKSPLVLSGKYSIFKVDQALFENNSATKGGGIYLGDPEQLTLQIDNSTFKSNHSTKGYGGGITQEKSNVNLSINNSKFINNSTDVKEAEIPGGAGAISAYETNMSSGISILSSIFEGNEVKNDENKNQPLAGAINYNEIANISGVNIYDSTFANNKGYGGGSAIAIKNRTENMNHYYIENNTFYKNKSETTSSEFNIGGAVLLYGLKEEDFNNYMITVSFRNNTLYKNEIVGSEVIQPKGGAIGISGIDGIHSISRNLVIGNDTSNKDPYTKNAIILKNSFQSSFNLGFDSGEIVNNDVEQAYGKYPVSLAENEGKNKAGRTEDAEVVKTLMIAPKMVNSKGEMYVGSANLHNYDLKNSLKIPKEEYYEQDQRGFNRMGDFDIGSLEISSVVYDANEGEFTLPELASYDGKTYYEGKNPQQYAKVSIPGEEYTILDGKKKLKPVRAGYEFLGWSETKDSTKPNEMYNTNTKHKVKDQLVLYAVWKENKYQLKYYGNGKTSGVSPIQKAVFASKEVTIKTQGKLKRKGYKFSGWSTKPSAKKGEAAYAPGKKLKLVKNTKLYAIWKR